MSDAADLVSRFFRTVLGPAHQTSLVPEFLSPEFVDHSAAESEAGPDDVAAKLDALWTALPNGSYRLQQVISGSGGWVATRSELVGGAHPVDFADFYRVAEGRIVEHWHVVDGAALASALGGG